MTILKYILYNDDDIVTLHTVWQRESSNLLIILAAASFPTTRKRNTNQLFLTPPFVFRRDVVDLFSLDSYVICLQMKTMIRGLLMLRNMITTATSLPHVRFFSSLTHFDIFKYTHIHIKWGEKKKDQIHDVDFNSPNIASPILIITIIIIQDTIIIKSSTNPVKLINDIIPNVTSLINPDH